jgi:hypothetical protein
MTIENIQYSEVILVHVCSCSFRGLLFVTNRAADEAAATQTHVAG